MGFLDKLFKPSIETFKGKKDYESLFAALRDPNLRQEAAKALEELGGEEVRSQPFAAALADEDPFVRQVARRMFDRLKILESLAQFLMKRQKWVDTPSARRVEVAAAGAFWLQLVGADAIGRGLDAADRKRHIELLIQALENPFIDSFAVKACGYTKEPATVRPLIALAKQDSIFEDDVVDSLKQISGKDFGGDLDAWLDWAEKSGL